MKKDLLNKILISFLFILGVSLIPSGNVDAAVYGTSGGVTFSLTPRTVSGSKFSCGNPGPLYFDYEVNAQNSSVNYYPYLERYDYNHQISYAQYTSPDFDRIRSDYFSLPQNLNNYFNFYVSSSDSSDYYIVKEEPLANAFTDRNGGSYYKKGTYTYNIQTSSYNPTNPENNYGIHDLNLTFHAVMKNNSSDWVDNHNSGSNIRISVLSDQFNYKLQDCSNHLFLENYLILEPNYYDQTRDDTPMTDSFRAFLESKNIIKDSSNGWQQYPTYGSASYIPSNFTCYIPLDGNTCYFNVKYGVLAKNSDGIDPETGFNNGSIISLFAWGSDLFIPGIVGDSLIGYQQSTPSNMAPRVVYHGEPIQIGLSRGSGLLDDLNGVGPNDSTTLHNPLNLNIVCAPSRNDDGSWSDSIWSNKYQKCVYKITCGGGYAYHEDTESCSSCEAGTHVELDAATGVYLCKANGTVGVTLSRNINGVMTKIPTTTDAQGNIMTVEKFPSGTNINVSFTTSGFNNDNVQCTLYVNGTKYGDSWLKGRSIVNVLDLDAKTVPLPNSSTKFSVKCNDSI